MTESHPRWFRRAAVAVGLLLGSAWTHAQPLFGFTPFPYDLSAEAVERTNAIVRDNSTIVALHLDDGIPWDEMLDHKPLPKAILKEWADWAKAIPPGRPVYLGLAPLAKDRKSLAPAKGGSMPWVLKLAQLDDRTVKNAYLEYARRAVEQFHPTYLNLGIEAGELASRRPRDWDEFEALYRHVAQGLKRDYPQLKIGISFGLQSLRKPDVAQRVKGLIDASDFLCLSFYPHMSPFGEKFGDPALREGVDAWREPLDWVRRYTSKPLAICETGYSTQNASLRSFDLNLKGSEQLQASYVRELAQYAERDRYLFVVWFLAVDYDRLYERMGGNSKDNEVNLLWRNIGLMSGDLRPKPAWAEWTKALAGKSGDRPLSKDISKEASKERPRPALLDLGMASGPLFQAGPGGRIDRDGEAMRWRFDYRGSEWMWAVRELSGVPAGAQRMALRVRSDREGPVFVQLEERSGETFVLQIQPTREWLSVNVALASLVPDPAKRKDGVLQSDQIVRATLADAGGRDRASGARQLWFAQWRFE